MRIIVCVKQVIDPEAPPSTFFIDEASKTAQFKGASPVIDPFAEHAVEAGLKIKDAAGATVTVLSLGENLQRDVIKKPLAMGADELFLLEGDEFKSIDSIGTVKALSAAISSLKDYDLILCGREASDTNAGQTGPGIARTLGLPCVTLARKITVGENAATIERVTSTGYDVISVPLPAVVTVSNEVGEARYPTIKGIMAAKKNNPTVWKLQDIGLDPKSLTGKRTVLQNLYQPVFEGNCEFVEAETPEESAVLLAQKLREIKAL